MSGSRFDDHWSEVRDVHSLVDPLNEAIDPKQFAKKLKLLEMLEKLEQQESNYPVWPFRMINIPLNFVVQLLPITVPAVSGFLIQILG